MAFLIDVIGGPRIARRIALGALAYSAILQVGLFKQFSLFNPNFSVLGLISVGTISALLIVLVFIWLWQNAV